MARTVIDPVTRAGGGLRVELDIAGGAIHEAWVSGTMFRGLEAALKGRDARDAWLLADRICGTCSGVHALASVRAVEASLGVSIPANARLIRNLLAGTLMVRDHVLGFYQAEGPDWVDLRAAAGADPYATARLAQAQSDRPGATPEAFKTARDRLAALTAADAPGAMGRGWWGHPAYRLSPEESLLIAAHHIEALDWQRNLMRIHALLGGKDPHPQTYLVGGMAVAAPWGGPKGQTGRDHPKVPDRNAPDALSTAGLLLVEGILAATRSFIDQVYLPDVRLMAKAYPDWAAIGVGLGAYLSAGEFPVDAGEGAARFLPEGRLQVGKLLSPQPVDGRAIGETIVHAWYASTSGDTAIEGPAASAATPAWPNLALPLTTLENAAKYSWIKAPRYEGLPMETGALARVLVAAANGRQEIATSLAGLLTDVGLTMEHMPGVLGRMLARAVEADVVCRQASTWLADLRTNLAAGDLAVADVTWWDPSSWRSETDGFSLGEGPRGTVGHWVGIRDGLITSYQVVDGSTWNASPRDDSGGLGPIESALAGVTLADPARPIEALRVIHSFAPCGGCASHVFRPTESTR